MKRLANFVLISLIFVLFLTVVNHLEAKHPIILDTDIGSAVDDAFALGFAVADPSIELRAVTTVGESAEDRAWIVCRFLTHVDKGEIPVAYGIGSQPKSPIDSQIQYRRHPAVVWNRTSKPVKESAVELILKTLKSDPGKITIVCVGPLTNIAQLFEKHPEARQLVRKLVIMGGSFRRGYDGRLPAVAEWNFKTDPRAAKTVFQAGVPIELVSLDATWQLQLTPQQLKDLFSHSSALTYQLQSLYELSDLSTKGMFDVAAIAAITNPKIATERVELPVSIDDQGMSTFGKGPTLVKTVTEIDQQELLSSYVKTITSAGPTNLPRAPKNPTTLISQSSFPTRVHTFEDYETDIERRWWLTGKPDEKEVPPGSRRSCRAMLTQDFDGKMGDKTTSYKAVVFNPVPGPPMGSRTQLSFRYKLRGTDTIRVQLFSLSRGFHRYLSVSNLKQNEWLQATVDMTQMRRPDQSGGPLSADERIDDIQFYIDPRADLWIDDIVLYEAAPIDNKLDKKLDNKLDKWPQRILFTGWFDTGKQGKEWPGKFEIVKHDPPRTWKKAASVPSADSDISMMINLRGQRPLAKRVRLRFQYFAKGSKQLEIGLRNSVTNQEIKTKLVIDDRAIWKEAIVDFEIPNASDQSTANEIVFYGDNNLRLEIDDLLLFVP
jgi:purine nucleosidase